MGKKSKKERKTGATDSEADAKRWVFMQERALQKMAHAVNNEGRARLTHEECTVVMGNLKRLAEVAEQAVNQEFGMFTDFREKVDKLSAEVEHWQANPKERKTLPQTLTHLAGRLKALQAGEVS